MLGHEVDGFRRNLLRGHGQIAFVFAVLVVDQHDHPPVADFLDRLFHAAEWGRVYRFHCLDSS